MEIVKKYWWILIISILIKLIISGFTLHSDIRHFDLGGQIVSQGNILNLFDFSKGSSELAQYNKINPLNYPPAIYFLNGFLSLIFTPFFGEEFIYNFLVNTEAILEDSRTNWHLISLKSPYFIFDLLIAFFLMSFFKTSREKLLAFTLWLFNPINIYSTFMVGQFDIIPTFFMVASLLLVKSNKVMLAALILGLGAAFKLFPLFLIIPLVLVQPSISKRIIAATIGILPYSLSIVPYLYSNGFRETALVANQSLKSLYAQINISGGESILLFPLFLVFVYLVFYFKNNDRENLWQRYFIVLLLFFIFTHFHPQWFLWVTPFLIIDLIKSNFKNLILVLTVLVSFIWMVFLFEPSLTIGLFSPAWPYLYSSLSIWQYLGINIDYNFSRSMAQTIFAAAAIYYIYESNYRST